MSTQNTSVIPAPTGYDVDFANPVRDWALVRATYWCYGVGTFLALFFVFQNIKLFINRKLDGKIGMSTSSFIFNQMSLIISGQVCLLLSWALSMIVQAFLLCKSERCFSVKTRNNPNGYVELVATVTDGLTGSHAWEMSIDSYNYWTLVRFNTLPSTLTRLDRKSSLPRNCRRHELTISPRFSMPLQQSTRLLPASRSSLFFSFTARCLLSNGGCGTLASRSPFSLATPSLLHVPCCLHATRSKGTGMSPSPRAVVLTAPSSTSPSPHSKS